MTTTAAPAAGSATRVLRVLVVDDDAMNLRIAARLLRELGHTGALVTDGNKALAILEQQTFDLMLLDVLMPGLDGLSTLQAVRKREQIRPGQRRLPVLMVSGHDSADTQQHFRSAGADGFVAKPLSSAVLKSEVARLVPR